MVPVFEEEEQFAEDLGQVRPVDFIDDEYEVVALFFFGSFSQAP